MAAGTAVAGSLAFTVTPGAWSPGEGEELVQSGKPNISTSIPKLQQQHEVEQVCEITSCWSFDVQALERP